MKKIKKIWYKIKEFGPIGDTYEKFIGAKKVVRLKKAQREELIRDGEKYIQIIENTLRETGALYYAYAGTLLGAIRDADFINWDLDIDYAVVITENFTWNDLEVQLNKVGFKKTRELVVNKSVKEQSYVCGRLNIDFFGQFYCEDKMIQYSFEYIPNYQYNNTDERSVYLVTLPKVKKTKAIMMKNISISVPVNSEEILTAIYNEDWRIPNPNWKSNSGNCSILLEDTIGYQILF